MPLLLAALSAFAIFSYQDIHKDDAYILLTYAKNIADGNGFRFNPTETIAGSTSFLFPILCAVLWKALAIFSSIELHSVGLILCSITLYITCLNLYLLLKEARLELAAMLVPLAILAHPALKFGVGMETFLTLSFLTRGLLHYSRNNFNRAFLFFGIAVMARPDAILAGFVAGIDYLFRFKKLPAVGAFIAGLLPILLLVAFNALYFGNPLPGTLAAKLAQTQSGRWGNGLIFISDLLSDKGIGIVLPSAAAIAFLACAAIKPGLLLTQAILPALLYTAMYKVAYGLILNPPGYPWYFVPIFIFSVLLCGLAIDLLLSRLEERYLKHLTVAAFTAATVLAFYLPTVWAPAEPLPKYQVYRKAAEWLNQNMPEGSSVAAAEIGVLGFFYENGPIIDGLGLVTAGATKHIKNRNWAWHIKQYWPDAVMVKHKPRGIESFVRDGWFRKAYRRATIVSTSRKKVAIFVKNESK